MKIHATYPYLWKCQKNPINFPSFAIMQLIHSQVPLTCVSEYSGAQKLMVIAAQLQQESIPTKIKVCGS